MKICIISDLHCKYQLNPNEACDTLLISNKPRKPINQHPVASILNLIEKESIKVDILLCPGDLGDKADEQGILMSWTFLEEIRAKLKANILIGIPGNHDINSRKNLDKEPFAFVKNFHENFPFQDDGNKAKFWDLGFCLYESDDILFLLINTVYDHSDRDKAQQSNIKKETLEKVAEHLIPYENRTFKHKICMLHHHPIKHSNINNWNDSDSIEHGDELVALLNKNIFSLVIHGHKHQPRITEYNSLPIFAAGSFSSFANLQGTGIQPMFHIVELDENKRRGILYSWEFDIVNGWSQKSNISFPPKIGFGSNKDIDAIAQEINEIFTKGDKKTILFENVSNSIEDLQYLIPERLEQLDNILKSRYKIKTTPGLPLEPIKLSEYLN
jgi:DNA repair exonuclease SbcCD nuclease subunit